MPLLKTFDALTGHLRACLAGRDRWVFVTTEEEAHLALVEFARDLTERGHGVSLWFGTASFCDTGTGMRFKVSVLTVPKAAAAVGSVARVLSDLGQPGPADDARDVVVISPDAPVIAGFLRLIRAGAVAPVQRPEVN